ncbi:MAG: hypothetical protein RR791_01280 [Lachnospiraceae bacterium]
MQTRIDLYTQLAEAEEDIINGDNGVDFFEFAKELRGKVYGSV